MENFFPQYGKRWVFGVARVRIFPRYGNFLREFSTLWKTFFHSVENRLKMLVFSRLLAVISGLLSGARRAPCQPAYPPFMS